ncbi:serine hydrolase domain-containing protein [uncultured Algoriphagus sp.]|uniref:serine hydrolase domain-containing protein n=1 Tax=uncultured Algoriphagus sp. TaxID=417365 RepID=UPI0030EC2F59|tara:strand:+ start:2087 stop:3208 length:1122 start_codon:yes stop_codon:yes gene_type:complete
MSKKIKIILAVLVFWVALFISWEWWYSFPKHVFKPALQVSSENDGIDSILNQSMATYLLPGISLAVVKNGKVSYLNAFGFKNLETKDSLTIESQILVASVSKLFTALALANVFQKLELLPEDNLYALGLSNNLKSPSLVTLRIQDFLSHQTGIRDKNFSEEIFSSSKLQSLQEWGDEFITNAHDYQKGSKAYNYADANYDLLGLFLSQSAGIDFDSVLQEEVLMPSGMFNSKFISTWPIDENGLTGYQRTFLWKRIVAKRMRFPILPSPSSGLLTTTKDMSLALVQLLRGDNGAHQKALKWLTIEGRDTPLGFQKTQINGREWIGHFGGQAGYSSLLFFSKDAKTAIFLFSNARDTSDFRIEIANQVISYISP